MESIESSVTCIHCGTEVKGNFCVTCGQRANVKRITFREGWNDFWARIYGFDGMFPRTLRDVTIRPGVASRKFIDGNRVAYYGPVGYFFLMITLLYLVASLLDINLVDFIKNSSGSALQDPPKPGSGQDKLMESTFRLVSDNLKLISFIIIPIQALCSRFLFFRQSHLNFTEHMVLPFYTIGHMYWLSIASLFLHVITGSFMANWIQFVVAMGYTSYAYANLFQYQSRLKAFVKGLGVYITTQLLFGLLIAFIVVLIIIFNQDTYEMIKPSNNK